VSNLFVAEARDIANYIERHGYAARIEADHILVRDPVQVWRGGARAPEYKDVKLDGWAAAMRFVEARS